MTFAGGKAIFITSLLALAAFDSASNASQAPQIQPIIIPALPIITSNPGEVILSWTAPGDDGNIGRADHYVVKYFPNFINESNWAGATTVPNPPAPLPPGSRQSFTFSGLSRGMPYYFAVKTYDEAGNASGLSNISRKFTGGIATPNPRRATVDSIGASATLYADSIQAAMPVKYQFALDLSASFPNPSLASDSLIDTLAAVTFANLTRNSRYFWHCRALAMDLSDSSLADLDIVVASIHSGFKNDEETMTNRVISAIHNEHVDIIGHPTGRIIQKRKPYPLNLDKVIEEAAAQHVALEINAYPERLDLDDVSSRKTMEAGALVSIGSDAHALNQMEFLPLGVSVARRGWLTAKDVANTRTANELLRLRRG